MEKLVVILLLFLLGGLIYCDAISTTHAGFCYTCGRVQTAWVNADPEYQSGLAWNL